MILHLLIKYMWKLDFRFVHLYQEWCSKQI